MKTKIDIGILICGGCNPTFDRGEVLDFVKSEFAPYANFHYYDDSANYHLTILINGCLSECLIDEINGPFVVISNNDKDHILTGILNKISKLNYRDGNI
jgi:hypothetical protein